MDNNRTIIKNVLLCYYLPRTIFPKIYKEASDINKSIGQIQKIRQFFIILKLEYTVNLCKTELIKTMAKIIVNSSETLNRFYEGFMRYLNPFKVKVPAIQKLGNRNQSNGFYTMGTLTFNPFRATGLFLYPLKTSKNLCFSDVFRGYRKRTVPSNGLMC